MADEVNYTQAIGNEVLDGTDLILSLDGKALGFSTGCKITTTAETGERLTKEMTGGKWKEKYVKNLSQEISADGCVLCEPDSNKPTYEEIMGAMLSAKPITASYAVRGTGREGSETNRREGQFVITSCELDGTAGEDAKYSIKLENSGAVVKVGKGISK